MNANWQTYASHNRLEAALALEVIPNRRMLRDTLRQRAPRAYRRLIFGQWRNRGR